MHADELYRIFRVCGTPNEDSWPGVSDLEHFGAHFPVWPRRKLQPLLTADPRHPGVDSSFVDLIERLLVYSPAERLNCKDALQLPLFTDDENDDDF